MDRSTPLIDIGVNLMHRSFHADREQVVERAAAAGITPLIITGTSVRSSREAAQYAACYPGKLYTTAGVHPHDAKSCSTDTIQQLRQLAAQPQVVSIGECGLDYNRDFSPRDVQRRWFGEQIQLAGELHMPLFLHERDAHETLSLCCESIRGLLIKRWCIVLPVLHRNCIRMWRWDCISVLRAGSVMNGAASICGSWSGIFHWTG